MLSVATLANFRSEVNFACGNINTDGSLDAIFNTRINWTIQNLAHILETPELQQTFERTLIAGVASYAVPNDYLYMLTLKNVDQDRELTVMLLHQEAQRDEDLSDEPTMYYPFNFQLVLHPTPSSAYSGNTIRGRYMALPDTLDDDTDTSPFSAHLDEAIVLGTVLRIRRDRGEFQRAEKAYRDFMGFLRSIRGSDDETIARAQLVLGHMVPSPVDSY